MEICAKTNYPPSCYDVEIPKLMSVLSMEEAFAVTRLVQEKDKKYLYCHVLGHNVSYRETSRDLSKWKDVVARCPTTFCNNGCQHGAIMRRFNAESLDDAQIAQVKPDLMVVCEPRGTWSPTEVERSMCYHALGHLNMFITKADINKSIGLCTEIGVKADGRNYIQTCTQGVMMSIYQPLEPEDFALVKNITPTKDTVDVFCNKFTGEAWYACHSESWPLFMEEISRPDGLMKFCQYASDAVGREKCVSTAMNILTVNMVVNKDDQLGDLRAFCTQLPAPYNGQCFAYAAFRLVQIDPRYTKTAMSVCSLAQEARVGDVCYAYLMGHATHSFHPASSEAQAFCAEFPQPWKEKCDTEISSKV